MTHGPIAGIIWDIDGTLVDTIDLITDALATAIIEHGGPELSAAEIVARFGPTEEGLLRSLVGERWPDAVETYLHEYEQGHDGVEFEEVRGAVLALHAAGIPQAVVTGKGERSALLTLRLIGLDDAFDRVAGGSMDGSVKAARIAAVVEAWGLAPDSVAYIGDSVSDIVEARAAGVVPIAAVWKPDADPDELARHRPAAMLSSGDDLERWIADSVKAAG